MIINGENDSGRGEKELIVGKYSLRSAELRISSLLKTNGIE